MTDVSEAEVEAAVGGALEDCGGWAIEPDEHRERFIKMIRAALTAAAQVRERARRENCKHPRKQGTGSLNSDGSSHSAWHCPDCGAAGEMKTPPRADGEGFHAMLWNATEPDSGPSVLGIPKGEE